MLTIVDVKTLDNYRVWIKFKDGPEGEVNLADLAGRGVFQAWEQPDVFSDVRITSNGALSWPGGIDLCPDALYLRLTQKSPEEIFPNLKVSGVDA